MKKRKIFLTRVAPFLAVNLWILASIPVSGQQSLVDSWRQKHSWVYQFEDEMSGGSLMFMEGPNTESQGQGPEDVPVVGANVRVSAPQVVGVNLLARSETTVTVNGEGRNIIAGWNTADGFRFFPFTNTITGAASRASDSQLTAERLSPMADQFRLARPLRS